MYVNNTERKHSCVIMAKTVTRTRHNVTLYVHCLSRFYFFIFFPFSFLHYFYTFIPVHAMKIEKQQRYSSTHSSYPRRYMDVSGQLHHLAALSRGKPQYPLSRRLCGAQRRFSRFGEEKILLPHTDSNP